MERPGLPAAEKASMPSSSGTCSNAFYGFLLRVEWIFPDGGDLHLVDDFEHSSFVSGGAIDTSLDGHAINGHGAAQSGIYTARSSSVILCRLRLGGDRAGLDQLLELLSDRSAFEMPGDAGIAFALQLRTDSLHRATLALSR